MSSRSIEALITACVGLAVVLGVRAGLGMAFRRYERRLGLRDPAEAARRRTTLGYLRRVVVAVVLSGAPGRPVGRVPVADRAARGGLGADRSGAGEGGAE